MSNQPMRVDVEILRLPWLVRLYCSDVYDECNYLLLLTRRYSVKCRNTLIAWQGPGFLCGRINFHAPVVCGKFKTVGSENSFGVFLRIRIVGGDFHRIVYNNLLLLYFFSSQKIIHYQKVKLRVNLNWKITILLYEYKKLLK